MASSKKIYNPKNQELTSNGIFKSDRIPPGYSEKMHSSAKLREMSGNNIFADGKSEYRDYYSGTRRPPRVFRYQSGKNSVLEVTKEAYNSRNTTNPLASYTDGETKVNLDRSGPFYFISGANGHCEKSQKLSLVVVSPRRQHSFSPAPSPSPVEFEDGPALAPAPTSGSPKLGGVGGYVVLGLVLSLWAWF